MSPSRSGSTTSNKGKEGGCSGGGRGRRGEGEVVTECAFVSFPGDKALLAARGVARAEQVLADDDAAATVTTAGASGNADVGATVAAASGDSAAGAHVSAAASSAAVGAAQVCTLPELLERHNVPFEFEVTTTTTTTSRAKIEHHTLCGCLVFL